MKKLNNEGEAVLKALNDLYVIRRNRYLVQSKGNTYTMLQGKISTNGRKIPPLVDSMLVKHLRGSATYGVFATNKTKFMLFDFDFANDFESCKWHYYKVYQALIESGVPDEFIYTTNSGMKGLHITLFFDQAINVADAQSFYERVLILAELAHMSEKIEFRPTTSQGVKLPLGVHTKTKKRIHFVENMNVDCVLPPTTILNVNKLAIDDVLTALNELGYDGAAASLISDNEVFEAFNDDVLTRVEPLEIYKLGVDDNYTIDYFNSLLEKGLKFKGTRHKATLQLVLFFKDHYGLDKEATADKILEWLNEQSGRYNTLYELALKDTLEIVDYVYDNDKSLHISNTEINVTIDEMRSIITAKTKEGKPFRPKQKAVLFALLIHSRRYTTTNKPTFYMTYDQIIEVTDYKNRKSLAELLTNFEAAGYITIHRRNEQCEGSHLNRPNIYEMNFETNKKADANATNIDNSLISVDTTVLCRSTFSCIVCDNFKQKDLQAMKLPRRQIEFFIS